MRTTDPAAIADAIVAEFAPKYVTPRREQIPGGVRLTFVHLARNLNDSSGVEIEITRGPNYRLCEFGRAATLPEYRKLYAKTERWELAASLMRIFGK